MTWLFLHGFHFHVGKGNSLTLSVWPAIIFQNFWLSSKRRHAKKPGQISIMFANITFQAQHYHNNKVHNHSISVFFGSKILMPKDVISWMLVVRLTNIWYLVWKPLEQWLQKCWGPACILIWCFNAYNRPRHNYILGVMCRYKNHIFKPLSDEGLKDVFFFRGTQLVYTHRKLVSSAETLGAMGTKVLGARILVSFYVVPQCLQ